MTKNLEIFRATNANLAEIKELMLIALKEDPQGFSVSFDEYNKNSDFWWFSYLDPYISGQRDILLLLKLDNKIVGMGGIAFENKERKKHVGLVVWMYILKDCRGKGLSKKLLQEVLNEAKKSNLEKLTLFVNGTQKAAFSLYEKFGFKKVGTLNKDMKIDGEYIDTNIMELFI